MFLCESNAWQDFHFLTPELSTLDISHFINTRAYIRYTQRQYYSTTHSSSITPLSSGVSGSVHSETEHNDRTLTPDSPKMSLLHKQKERQASWQRVSHYNVNVWDTGQDETPIKSTAPVDRVWPCWKSWRSYGDTVEEVRAFSIL